MALVAGVDSSTQSCTVVVRDAETGALVASGRAPHPTPTPPRSEQDPAVWWHALEAAYADAGAPDVDAVAVAGQQHGLVVTDAAGNPLRPAKLWNDTESARQAAALVAERGARWWATATGSVPVAAHTVAKLAWLREHEPAMLDAAAHVCLPHDWLTWRLAGRWVTDRGDASGTGYWSPGDDAWCDAALAAVDPDRDWRPLLPAVHGPAEPAGSGRLGAAAPLVGCGTGDNMAAALGVALAPGDVLVGLGTSGTVCATSTSPVADATGAVAGFADAAGAFLPLVCTLNATKVTDAVARLLGVDHAALDVLALAAPPGADGLVLLPYLDGERTPNRPDATGVVAGLRSDVGRDRFACAAFEGVVCGILDALDALAATGVGTDGRLVLVGGGAQSVAYRTILASCAGRPVTLPDVVEPVATGAALQAAAQLAGTAPDVLVGAWGLGAGRLVEPAPGGPAAAADLRAAYAAVRDATPGVTLKSGAPMSIFTGAGSAAAGAGPRDRGARRARDPTLRTPKREYIMLGAEVVTTTPIDPGAAAAGVGATIAIVWGFYFVLAIVFGFVCMSIMGKKGYSKGLGFVLGFFGGVIGLIVALVLNAKQPAVPIQPYVQPQGQVAATEYPTQL